MKRICIAISSNDKDTTMHLEIYAPEYKGDLKGLIQICHGMTEYMGRYVEFAKYFTSRGYIVFGNDIISHGHSTTPRSSCLYINDWNDTVKDMVSAREYVVRKYPNLPIYLLGFSLGSFIVRTNADLTPYKSNPDRCRCAVALPDAVNANLDREIIYRKDVLRLLIRCMI